MRLESFTVLPPEIVAYAEREHQETAIGKFFERTDMPSLHEAEPVLKNGPLVKQDNRLPADVAKAFIDELM